MKHNEIHEMPEELENEIEIIRRFFIENFGTDKIDNNHINELIDNIIFGSDLNVHK